jgi:hypothetical protein
MLTLPDGALALMRAAQSVPPDSFDRIVVAVRADHEAAYGCRALLSRAFGDAAEVVVLAAETRGPADTVAQAIHMGAISGPVLIKDADSFFDPTPLPAGSFVSVSDVRHTPEMSNLGAKSFAVIDDAGRIVQMVEKSLVSNFVCVGLYGIADAGLFLDHFQAVASERQTGEMFVSHVFSHAITAGIRVMPHAVCGLIDVGTLEDWRRHVRARGTIICDLDGVVFKNHSRYFPPYWHEAEEPIAANVASLREWQTGGAQLIFMTARPEAHRAQTEAELAALGLAAHALIMDCRHGRRLLVNDHAASNPCPSAVGISLPRDTPTLGDYLKDWK